MAKQQKTKFTIRSEEVRRIAHELNDKLVLSPALDTEAEITELIKEIKELKGQIDPQDQLTPRAFTFLQAVKVIPEGEINVPPPKVMIRRVLKKQSIIRNALGYRLDSPPERIDRFFLRPEGATIDEVVRAISIGRITEEQARKRVYDRIDWYKRTMRSKGWVWFYKDPKTKIIRVGVGKRSRKPNRKRK